MAYCDALVAVGVRASVGTVASSNDNAMAQTVNGLYKLKLIHSQRVWESTQTLKNATMQRVH